MSFEAEIANRSEKLIIQRSSTVVNFTVALGDA